MRESVSERLKGLEGRDGQEGLEGRDRQDGLEGKSKRGRNGFQPFLPLQPFLP
jgi:hypothetical protein